MYQFVTGIGLATLLVTAAYATDLGYNQASGNWTTGANWNPTSTKPATGDRVFLGGGFVGGQAATTEVTLNTDESAQTISEIWVGSLGVGGANAGTLNVQTGAKLITNGRMRIGGGVNGIVNQSGGTITWTANDLGVGDNSGGSGPGTFNMTGGLITGMSQIYLGNGNAGTFNNNGGIIVSTGGLSGLGTVATYNQTAGAATFNSYVSGGGTFNFTVSGGTFTTSAGQFAAGRGTTTIGGGTLTTGYTHFGYGSGDNTIINQTAGNWSVTAGNEIWVGDASGATATYNMQGGTLGQISGTGGRFIVGVFGAGTLTQSGGTINANQFDISGYGGSGTYTLSGGTLNANTFNKGSGGNLTFSGGTLSANTVSFNLLNNGGALAPGLTNTTGKTQINGNYTISSSTAKLSLQLGGLGQGLALAGYDWVNVTGTAALGGLLDVSLVNSFTPTFTDSFTNVVAGTLSGFFANAGVSGNTYDLGGGNNFRVTYNSGKVILDQYTFTPTAVVPEPTIAFLLGLGGVVILRRVRRRAGSARN